MMFKITIKKEKCKTCLLCVNACARGVLCLSEESNARGFRYIAARNPDRCVGCLMCALMCPECAIEIDERSGTNGTPERAGGKKKNETKKK